MIKQKKRTFIIAEAGVNHNGQIDLAYKLIDAAILAGADAVKFQTFNVTALTTKLAPKAEYQTKTSDSCEYQYDMIKKLELSHETHVKLLKYCKSKGIIFLSSPFDLDSIVFLCKLGLDIIKVPSGEITNLPYLQLLGSLNKQIILSTGMASISEVKDALTLLTKNGTNKENIIILHCNTEYPTPIEDVNLRAMQTMREQFAIEVGYSDHTLGIEVSLAAVAIGAKVIEKHFTLDKNMEGPDHKSSLDTNELKMLVQSIRKVEKALGNGRKCISPSESKNIFAVRKSIVAARNITKGEKFTVENITVKRPGNGISPMKWNDVIGQIANQKFSKDQLIEVK